MDEFFRVSQCKSAKEMWEILEVNMKEPMMLREQGSMP